MQRSTIGCFKEWTRAASVEAAKTAGLIYDETWPHFVNCDRWHGLKVASIILSAMQWAYFAGQCGSFWEKDEDVTA